MSASGAADPGAAEPGAAEAGARASVKARVEWPSARAWAAALLGLAALTAVLVTWRDRLSVAHVTLAYLLLSQVASATGGRTLGLAVAGASFLCFDYFFLPPYGTMIVRDPLDWIVLVTFLATSALTAQLLHRSRRDAAVARARAEEVTRLAAEASEAGALREAARLKDALLASVSPRHLGFNR